MVNLFSTVLGFAAFFKSREDQTIRIDNVGWGTSLTSSKKVYRALTRFRLHYGFTAGFLFLSTALLGILNSSQL